MRKAQTSWRCRSSQLSVRLAALALTLAASEARAQKPMGSIDGIARDTTARLLSNVDITIRPGNITVRTDDRGRFTFPSVEPGAHTLRARAIGFFPVDVDVAVAAGKRTSVEIMFRRRFTALDTVVVTARTSCARFTVDGFSCRRQTGHGSFFDFRDIAAMNADQVGDIFRHAKGFRVDYEPCRPTPSGDCIAVVRGSPTFYSPNGMPTAVPKSEVGLRCLQVLVDGRPVSVTNPMPEHQEDLAAIEIYKSGFDVPPYFRNEARNNLCAIAVMWTWAGIPRRMR
jgi:hypothetical protein